MRVQSDHLDRLVKSPTAGLVELVWNAFDADANDVAITLERNQLGGLTTIKLTDDGLGMTSQQVNEFFGRLGGSWKSTAATTPGGRALHGSHGEGRYKAFGVGGLVSWRSVAEVAGERRLTTVTGNAGTLDRMAVDDGGDTPDPCGTTVTIDQLNDRTVQLLDRGDLAAKLTAVFALFLEKHPVVRLHLDGTRIDPKAMQTATTAIPLAAEGIDGDLELRIIEWSHSVERAIYLLADDETPLGEVPPGIQAPGFNFTAYLRWNGFAQHTDTIALGEFADEPLPTVIQAAKESLREHFRARSAERGRELIQSWKDDESYPFRDQPSTELEAAERSLFDVVALAAAPAVANTKTSERAFSLGLLRQALEANPGSLRRVLSEVLRLDKSQVDELDSLLKRSPLPRLISAARLITDRLDFLEGLEQMVFSKDMREDVRERDQLHRVIASET